MAASVDSPSPAHLTNKATTRIASSPLFSPASDKRFWSSLRGRIDTILESRQRKVAVGQDQLSLEPSSTTHTVGESDRAKRMKEDALLLLRGFDSIAHNLSQLSNNLDNALQGARCLAEPPTLREIFHCSLEKEEIKQNGLENQQSKDEEEKTTKGLKRKLDTTDNSADEETGSLKENDDNSGDKKLKKAKNIAISMATKAAALARELKSIRSDLCFTQERCSLLEEENRRLRDGYYGGTRPEEDDLIRLQMEALLAEKSRLANENANLKRENQCLHQLVEYHQITTQDLSASYEQFMQGICLDFSSPSSSQGEEEEADNPETPPKDIGNLSTSLDECFQEEQESR